jgi:hypothetical protein
MAGKPIHIHETEKRESTLTEAKIRAAKAAVPRMAVGGVHVDKGESVDSRGVIMHSTVKR